MSKLPIPPEQPDTQMSQLFIDCWGEECAMNVLKTRHSSYGEARQRHIAEYPMRYLEIIKEYQEQIFAQPVKEEESE